MKKTIVFDFDGVIHKGYKGWKDGSIYGEIDFELLNYMSEYSSKYATQCALAQIDVILDKIQELKKEMK